MQKCFLFFALLPCLCGFSQSPELSFFQRTLRNFRIQTGSFPQEKIWLHTDRNMYQAGERIWFRAFLVDAATHQLSPYSRFVYVELTNRSGQMIRRVKLREADSVYAGYLDLGRKLPEGDYYLRAYSYWMLNQGEEHICKKKIRIVNPDEVYVQTTVEYKEGEEQYAEIAFKNLRDEAYPEVSVRCHYTSPEGTTKTRHLRTDKEGKIKINRTEVADSLPLHLSFSGSKPFFFEKQLYLPGLPDDFDLAFFPEGGSFLCGEMQAIAYKAIGSDGLSVDISGFVYDETGEIRGIINTLYKGMGTVQLQAGQEERFYAVVKNADGKEKRFDLPVPDAGAVNLSVQQRDTILTYRAVRSMDAAWPDSLYVLGHIRGKVVLFELLEQGQSQGIMTSSIGEEGILHLLLLDSRCRIFSQRLCFIRKPSVEMIVGTDRKFYAPRDVVTLGLNFQLPGTEKGSFSLAVTDDNQYNNENTDHNIVSELLLNSDLKGYIEEPAGYFRNINRNTNYFLDLLMLTQGWSRFDVEKTIAGTYPEQKFFLERGQAVSGRVDNIWGKDVQDAQLVLLSSNRIMRILKTDTAGRFTVDGIEFPDATSFFVQARGKRGGRTVAVYVDKEEFPEPAFYFPGSRYEKKEEEAPRRMEFGRDYYYVDGMKVYILNEVRVSGSASRKPASFYESMFWYSIDSSAIAQAGNGSIVDIVEMLPGLTMDLGESIVTRYGRKLMIVVNDRVEDFNYLQTLPPEQVINIGLMEPQQADFYFSSALNQEGEETSNSAEFDGGALVVTLGKKFIPKANRPNIQVFRPLGFQKPLEFYMPRYGVDSVRVALRDSADNRKTVYWNPNVRIDSSAPLKLSFYTTDYTGPYTVVLEGILQNGRVVRKEQKIMEQVVKKSNAGK